MIAELVHADAAHEFVSAPTCRVLQQVESLHCGDSHQTSVGPDGFWMIHRPDAGFLNKWSSLRYGTHIARKGDEQSKEVQLW
jgi:hypothetical protein